MPALDLAPIVNTPGTRPRAHTVELARIAEEQCRRWGFQLTMIYGSTTWDDHDNLKCCDLMVSSARRIEDNLTRGLSVPEQKALGARLRDWLSDHAKPLGITGIIWWHEVTGFPHGSFLHYRGPYGQPRPYRGSNPHVDHNHVENDGTGVDPAWARAFWADPDDPAKVKAYTLLVTKDVAGYYGPSRPGEIRFKPGRVGHGRKGGQLTGTVQYLADGRYLVTKYGTWYPLDSGNFSHLDGRKIGR